MSKRVYWETVKKWGIRVGIVGVSVFSLLFIYLNYSGLITIISHSGDMVCAGTLNDPCYAIITFIPNEDIFIYPTNYDPWGRNTPFNFSNGITDWKMERSWGKGWREIKLNQSCKGTWCGASNNLGGTYAYAFRRGRIYKIRVTAYKDNPERDVKWGFTDKLDPVWKGKLPDEMGWGYDKINNQDGSTSIILYSGVRNVKDSKGEWTRIEFADSLKPAMDAGMINVKYLKKESGFDFKVKELNYNYIEFEMSNLKSENVPIKVDGIQVSLATQASDKIPFKFEAANTTDNIFMHNYTIGKNSTTIQLQDADTKNIDDTYVDADNDNNAYGSSQYMYSLSKAGYYRNFDIKWNITDLLPAGSSLEDADNCVFLEYEAIDASEEMDVKTYKIYPNFTISGSEWTEDTLTYNEWLNIYPDYYSDAYGSVDDESDSINFGSSPTQDIYYCWNVTDYVQESLDDGDLNVTIDFNSTNGVGLESSDHLYWRSKEMTGSDKDPILNITYSDPSTTTSTTTSSTTTTTISICNSCEIDCANYCNISDEVRDCNNYFSVYSTGIGHVNISNSNITYKNLKLNATHECKIILNNIGVVTLNQTG